MSILKFVSHKFEENKHLRCYVNIFVGHKFEKQPFELLCKYKMHATVSALRSSEQPLKLKQLQPTAALGWIRAHTFLN